MKAAFIYMASGFGSRFGGNKLLEELEGKPLYRHGLDTLRKAADLIRREKGWQIRLIVVSQYREILEEAAREGLQAVYNPESARGITASIAYGTRAAEGTDIFLYFVADQPRLRPETTAGFLKAFADSGKTMGCLAWNGRRGNPAAFRSCWRPELLSLQGDKGGRQLMARYPDEVWLYPASEEELWDVDHREDLEKNAGEEMRDGSRTEE
ncbi:MAG: nucleotidyltransferase family protein [Lachnospiraceae bacterium]|uniref:Nucleotidyltransferase family protein n=1 Tax=Candidatus Enterocloster excrementigallinarum TaxID=2838558 RepID=A0A9D2PUJ7_9FIRM|nr:nucleotidyltransferase family protein [Lachnospiraceae bacterium]HJC65972.1 nucleotidyltransferase family protein [Candidatus Enterocloster excrementigallinarum]